MLNNTLTIPININDEIVELTIYGEDNTAFETIDSMENGEAHFQLVEGCFYEYSLTNKNFHLQASEVVSQSKVNPSSGRIAPNIYVGTLSLPIVSKHTKEQVAEIKIEIRSLKASYRTDYRLMLEEIAEKSIDLIFAHNSIVSQQFNADANVEPKILYQQFAFLKSILESDEFNYGVQKILYAPVTQWSDTIRDCDTRGLKRVGNSTLRQMVGTGNRIKLPENHYLSNKLSSIPAKVKVSQKIDTVDTPENRFIKFALTQFLYFIQNIVAKAKGAERLLLEASSLEQTLEGYLSHSIFREISNPDTVSLNSPILQRKEGYREVLRAWIMFDYAASLAWKGGEDVYSGGKKNIAVLYEYWLFFKLLDLVKEVFSVEPEALADLIDTNGGLTLNLKQGKHLPIKGVFERGNRKLNVQFSYNRTFSGDKKYPEGGSWSRDLRPDYTLTIWPFDITDEQAEREELITHIHFDAKYKVENFASLLDANDNLSEEKQEQSKGTYKRADILKMHTYRDAIRRTSGAYVLYPGIDKPKPISGFHEILPGLGAFAIRPSKSDDGTVALKDFLKDVLKHFMNRASQRETISYKTYDTFKENPADEVSEPLPEAYGTNRGLLPNETYVLVGYYNSPEQLNWICKKNLYNFRTGTNLGSLPLGYKETSAKYLLLHGKGETRTGRIFKLKEIGPKIFSKEDLIRLDYPNPSHDLYIIYTIDMSAEKDFNSQIWDITKLPNQGKNRISAKPNVVSLGQLLRSRVFDK